MLRETITIKGNKPRLLPQTSNGIKSLHFYFPRQRKTFCHPHSLSEADRNSPASATIFSGCQSALYHI